MSENDFAPPVGTARPLANGAVEEWDGIEWREVVPATAQTPPPPRSGSEGVGGRPPKGWTPPAC